MANLLYANNAAGTLAAGISTTANQVTLNVGQAGLFPAPAGGQSFYATLTDAATQTLIEIVQVTGVSGNVFAITRAQDGTTALSWNPGDIISQRTIALELRAFENAAEGNFAALAVPVTPSTTQGVVGTTLADNANAGSVGEYMANSVATSVIPIAVAQNRGSLALTPGDWDVSGVGTFNPDPTSAVTAVVVSISTVSGSQPPASAAATTALDAAFGTGTGFAISTPVVRINVSVNTTVFLVAQMNYSGPAGVVAGFIRARRVR